MKQQCDDEYILLKTDVPQYYSLGSGDWIEVFNPLTIISLITRFNRDLLQHDKAVEQLSSMILESIIKRGKFSSENMQSYTAFSIAKNIYDWGAEDRVLLFTKSNLIKLQGIPPDKIKQLNFRKIEPYEYKETGSVANVLFRLKGI